MKLFCILEKTFNTKFDKIIITFTDQTEMTCYFI